MVDVSTELTSDPKDKVRLEAQGYEIHCKSSNLSYIDQTKRKISVSGEEQTNNLSDRQLPNAAKQVLSKDFHYVNRSEQTTSEEDLVCTIHTKEHTPTKEESQYRGAEGANRDKGNVIVVLNTRDYKDKMQTFLDDRTNKPITTDLEKTTRTKINNALLSEKKTKNFIISKEKSLKCLKMYDLPKIHKHV
ncbi:hypothetical protein Trydic_g11725 [Trypoxylus dichotomus]